MDAEVKTIEQLFSQPVQYVIPQFQRFYDWEKEKQWEPLWDDVRNVAEAVLAHDPEKDQRVPPHFMGSLVLQGEPMPNKGVPTELGRRQIVVDGQQRLTTIQVLARAIIGAADALGHDQEVEPLRVLIANIGLPDDWRYKVLQAHPRDVAAYQNLMNEDHGDKSFRDTPILGHDRDIPACHNYLTQMASEYLDPDDPDLRARQVHALQQTICQHLQFAILTLDDDEQPNMVFETINARGQGLAEHQLVKSTVMYQAGVSLDGETANKCWHAFDDDNWWGAQNQDTGHISKFLAAWLASARLKNVQTQRISAEFRAFVNQWKRDQDNVWPAFDLMNHAGLTYHNIITRADKDYGLFHADMTAINAQFTMSACLWMMEPANGLDPEEAERIIELLESYAFRRALVGRSTNFLPIILTMHQAAQNRQDIREKVRDSIRDLTSARPEYWPEDKFIKEHVALNSCKAGKPIRTILRRVEDHLRAEAPATPLPPDATLSDHHLMPTAPSQWDPAGNWPVSRGNRSAATARRSALVNQIGNITIIAGKRSQLKSKETVPWTQKRDLLQAGTTLHINEELLDMETWDEDAIQARSSHIADLATQIWRR